VLGGMVPAFRSEVRETAEHTLRAVFAQVRLTLVLPHTPDIPLARLVTKPSRGGQAWFSHR